MVALSRQQSQQAFVRVLRDVIGADEGSPIDRALHKCGISNLLDLLAIQPQDIQDMYYEIPGLEGADNQPEIVSLNIAEANLLRRAWD